MRRLKEASPVVFEFSILTFKKKKKEKKMLSPSEI